MTATGKESRTSQLEREDVIREPREGIVVRVGGGREVWVDYPGNSRGPLKARTSPMLDMELVRRLAPERPGALLLFADGDPARPVLMTLLDPPVETPLTDAVLSQTLSRVPTEARVDGERVVISGRREVVLECGKARITLRRDGTVCVRGLNLVSEAEEVNRIRGGKVRIN